ncbi:hypothetical protein HQ529_04880 [Candidatus Woesearchaeota archaeon]|nr:hypothetical protein [Candidatus Woesearchaeota archaeon]
MENPLPAMFDKREREENEKRLGEIKVMLNEIWYMWEFLKTFYENSGKTFWGKTRLHGIYKKCDSIQTGIEEFAKQGHGNISTQIIKEWFSDVKEWNEYYKKIYDKKRKKIERKWHFNLANLDQLKKITPESLKKAKRSLKNQVDQIKYN